MSEFTKGDCQLDLALVEETLQEYLLTGDVHSENVALLFPTTPRVYKGGIHTEVNTYNAFTAFIDHPVLEKLNLVIASVVGLELKADEPSGPAIFTFVVVVPVVAVVV